MQGECHNIVFVSTKNSSFCLSYDDLPLKKILSSLCDAIHAIIFANRCVRGTSGIIARNVAALPYRCAGALARNFSNKQDSGSQLSSSSLLAQDGLSVRELPVIVRKINDVMVLCQNSWIPDSKCENSAETESGNYPLIQEEFNQCQDLKDVFTLLSKCSKITANIALAAVERIYQVENLVTPFGDKMKELNINVAKGAILDKLMNVLLRTEDTQTLLHALRAVSCVVEQQRYKFSNELLARVSDGKLSIEQLCEFVHFLSANKSDPHFADAVDKLWTGFVEREREIDESNLVAVYKVVPALRASKNTVLSLLEKKLILLWWKLKAPEMQDILEVLWRERHSSHRTLQVVGRWTNTNIHTLTEDALLNIVTKMTGLKYTDNQFEKALERYVKVKGVKINSPALMVAVLNHCMEFRLRSTHILNGCSEYFSTKGMSIPAMFLKSFLYPFGYLCFHPTNAVPFWRMVESTLEDKFSKLKTEDILDIMLSCIYLEKYPLNFVDKIFNSVFLDKLNNSRNPDLLRIKLKLIDTAMSLECKSYSGPLLPKDHWAKSVNHDSRTWRLVNGIRDSVEKIAGGPDCYSTGVIIPHLYANELYVIDVMLHPARLGSSILHLKLRSDRNVNVALLLHLPEHYCFGSEQLVGPQVMRKKHLRILGLKVVSLNYKTLSTLKMHREQLEKYLVKCLKEAEPSL